jgi:hypothetical protein
LRTYAAIFFLIGALCVPSFRWVSRHHYCSWLIIWM